MISKELRTLYKNKLYAAEFERFYLEYYIAQLTWAISKDLEDRFSIEVTEKDIEDLKGVCDRLERLSVKLPNISVTRIGEVTLSIPHSLESTVDSTQRVFSSISYINANLFSVFDGRLIIPSLPLLSQRGRGPIAEYFKPKAFGIILKAWYSQGCNPDSVFLASLLKVLSVEARPPAVIEFPNPKIELGLVIHSETKRIAIRNGAAVFDLTGSHLDEFGSNWTVLA